MGLKGWGGGGRWHKASVSDCLPVGPSPLHISRGGWAPLTRKWHIPPHPAPPQHTNHWAPRTRKRHQQEHRPQRPTERSDPTQHAEGRAGDCPGPRKGATPRRTVTHGGGGGALEPAEGRGGGSGKGAFVTGQSNEARLNTLMMTHHLRRKVAQKICFSQTIPPMIHTSK